MTDVIVEKLRKAKGVGRLSRETVRYLCAFNNIRQMQGNYNAHNADQVEIRNAVMLEKNSQDAPQLDELYHFVFPA